MAIALGLIVAVGLAAVIYCALMAYDVKDSTVVSDATIEEWYKTSLNWEEFYTKWQEDGRKVTNNQFQYLIHLRFKYLEKRAYCGQDIDT